MRKALEHRLNAVARETGADVMRLRRQAGFDRFLARLFHGGVAGLVTKGGYSLDLRLESARTTKDIDFSFAGDLDRHWDGTPDGLQAFVAEKMKNDLGDFMAFEVGNATLDLEGAPYGGFRFPVRVRMAGRRFAEFSVDIAAGDAWFEPHDMVELHGWFDFAGIPTTSIPVISMEQQLAEKLHAYTMQRGRPNSRVKDLVDMVLIVESNKLSTERLRQVAEATFAKREESEYPPQFAGPPDAWRSAFAMLAEECRIEKDIDQAADFVRSYCIKAGIALS
jgi:hypothetical protein